MTTKMCVTVEPPVTDEECQGRHECGLCSLYGQCDDRRPIERCKLCGNGYTDEELFSGVCKDCLTEAIDAQTVRDYVQAQATGDNNLWEALFESYFSSAGDKCRIDRASDALIQHLSQCILRDWANDRLLGRTTCKDKLIAFIGDDDDDGWADFADWILEKK